jgi:hypothetical protein
VRSRRGGWVGVREEGPLVAAQPPHRDRCRQSTIEQPVNDCSSLARPCPVTRSGRYARQSHIDSPVCRDNQRDQSNSGDGLRHARDSSSHPSPIDLHHRGNILWIMSEAEAKREREREREVEKVGSPGYAPVVVPILIVVSVIWNNPSTKLFKAFNV